MFPSHRRGHQLPSLYRAEIMPRSESDCEHVRKLVVETTRLVPCPCRQVPIRKAAGRQAPPRGHTSGSVLTIRNERNGYSQRHRPSRALRGGRGCATVVACLNAAGMGLLASTFMVGPYSSAGQELWYRYGSAAFLLLGVVLPVAALLFGAQRYPTLITAATIWMIAIWLPFVGFVIMSGGGV